MLASLLFPNGSPQWALILRNWAVIGMVLITAIVVFGKMVGKR